MLVSRLVLGGRYRLDEVIGRGRAATVWRAWDAERECQVAVKVLDAGWRADEVALARLRRDTRTLASLAHPNIVAQAYHVDGVAAYLVMDVMDAPTLADRIAGSGRQPVAEAVRIATAICDALRAVHAAGVVHGAIHPGNVFLHVDEVTVTDGGVIRPSVSTALAVRGEAADGRAAFVAPESSRGEADAPADLYALGAVLFTMLTGRAPTTGDGAAAPVRKHRGDVPPELDRLVGELLAVAPADRPPTAAEVAARLAAPRPATARPPLGGEVPRHRAATIAGRLRNGRVAALAALGAGAVLLAIVTAGPDTTDPSPGRMAGLDPPVTATPAPPSHPSPSPSHAPTTASATATREPSVATRLVHLAMALRRQVDAGRLDARAAQALFTDLARAGTLLEGGDAVAAARAFAHVRRAIARLYRDGRLTSAGFAALPDLAAIAASLPAAGRPEEAPPPPLPPVPAVPR
jgi:serine/threonine-protein kinase